MIKHLILLFVNRYFLSHKSNWISENIPVAKPQSLRLIFSSECVLFCEIPEGKKYLRLIRRHCSLKEYLSTTVDMFFDFSGSESDMERFRKSAQQDLLSEENYRKAVDAEAICRKNAKSITSYTFERIEDFGFPSLKNPDFAPFICPFILFLRGEMASFRNNRNTKTNSYQCFRANLQCATKSLAELLGVGSLIPNVEIAKLYYKGKYYLVTMMDEAPGTPANLMDMDRRQNLDPTFIRDITNLEYLDAICYQTDHKQRNYNVINDQNNVLVGASAFDNDAPLTFLPVRIFPKKVTLISRYAPVCDGGKICRSVMDREFYQALNGVSKKDIKRVLSGYLKPAQIGAAWYRIKRLRRAAERTAKKDVAFLVDFSKNTSSEKLLERVSVEGRNDYLHSFLTFDERSTYEHIKL